MERFFWPLGTVSTMRLFSDSAGEGRTLRGHEIALITGQGQGRWCSHAWSPPAVASLPPPPSQRSVIHCPLPWWGDYLRSQVFLGTFRISSQRWNSAFLAAVIWARCFVAWAAEAGPRFLFFWPAGAADKEVFTLSAWWFTHSALTTQLERHYPTLCSH